MSEEKEKSFIRKIKKQKVKDLEAQKKSVIITKTIEEKVTASEEK